MYQVNTSNVVSSSSFELTNKLNTGHLYSPHVSSKLVSTQWVVELAGYLGTSNLETGNLVIGSRFTSVTIGNNINKYEN